MYIEVLAVGIIGAILARLQPHGIERALFATALTETLTVDEGRDSAALTRFFDELGPQRAAQLQAISIDMSAAYLKAIGQHDDVDATVCFDSFHVAQLG